MGMYTRLPLNVALTCGNPELIETIRRMVNGKAEEFDDRRRWMLTSSSFYHDNIQHASLEYDDISKCHKLSVCCDIKNYEQEIELFLGTIAPIARSRFAGYIRYEESTAPTLIWFDSGKLITFTPELPRELAKKLDGL